MIFVSVKPEYESVYGGLHFEGEMKSHPRLLHGCWICEVYLAENRKAVSFRLGHLTELGNTNEGVDGLKDAEAAGWNGEVATDAQEVTVWSARELAWGMIHIAGYPGIETGAKLPPGEPGPIAWEALEVNLGRPADRQERTVFEAELRRVLADPTVTNEWPLG